MKQTVTQCDFCEKQMPEQSLVLLIDGHALDVCLKCSLEKSIESAFQLVITRRRKAVEDF